MNYLSADQVSAFHRDGYLLVPGFLDAAETANLLEAARKDEKLQKSGMDVKDSQGRRTNLSLWNHPGNDIYGAIARCARVVNSVEQLLDDEVYHYHSKLSAKEPKVGGAWEWHQDYGYWYFNGCLYPDMLSVFIAVDPCTRENGCLQVLRGSHKMGRVDHGRFGEQVGADPERIAEARRRHETVHCLMSPGDALFFHSNLFHASEPNLSDKPRWGLICCYNTRHNDPFKDSHHPRYTPLLKLPDDAIKTIGPKPSEAAQRFLKQAEDHTTGSEEIGKPASGVVGKRSEG
jgi:ectoine hydroxylase-related dioxygenase (phytanoyl-CoA dioxygenase family)